MSIINEIKPGTVVEAIYKNAIHDDVGFKLDYIGCVSQEFLLFNLTSNKQSLNEINMLRPGLVVHLRVIIGTDNLIMLNFKTELMMITTVNVPVMVVSFPKDVRQRQIRCEPRLKIELMVRLLLRSTNTEHLALATDISKSGIHCEYHPTEIEIYNAGPSTLLDLIDEDVDIEFPPDEEHLEPTTLRGKIKNIRGKEKLAVGILFDQDDQPAIKSFYALLLIKEHGL